MLTLAISRGSVNVAKVRSLELLLHFYLAPPGLLPHYRGAPLKSKEKTLSDDLRKGSRGWLAIRSLSPQQALFSSLD
jgi:hypothetical protein